jgi:3-isopropylmalate/(R)-2-methylmalate dehydratase small subunit
MSEKPTIVTRIEGRGIPLRGSDIDTDRIIPARFLRSVTFEGLGEYAFCDERYDPNGSPLAHPFNDDRFKGHDILIVESNFGCGSSREHAPQSLARAGIRAVVGESFADIFAGNCTMIGVPTITANRDRIVELLALVEERPDTSITINLEGREVIAAEKRIEVALSNSVRNSFLTGHWDTVSLLLKNSESIKKTADSLAYPNYE